MKVEAIRHVRQTIGSISVERVIGETFDLDQDEALAAKDAGLIRLIEQPTPKRPRPKLETR